MFTLLDVRIAIDEIGFMHANKFSFDISSTPQTHQNLKGDIVAYSFGDGIKGNIKMSIDTDIVQEFFSRMWHRELKILLQSKLSNEGRSWLNFLIKKNVTQTSDFSSLEFRCFLSGFGESLETKAGIRETEVQLEILGLKVDGEAFRFFPKLAQFAEDTSQLKIDGKNFMPGVLVDLGYENVLIHERKDIDSSNVSYRIIKGFDEGKVSARVLIFDHNKDRTKEVILREFNDLFFQQELDEKGKNRPKVRFISHPCLFHQYYLIEKVSYSLKKDFIEVNFNLLEYQAIERDKLASRDSDFSTIREGLEIKEITPSGRIEKDPDSLILKNEIIKNKSDLRKGVKSTYF